MNIQNRNRETAKINFYNEVPIEIRKENSKYSLYVNEVYVSDKVSDFSLVKDYLFCHGRNNSLIYYSFKTKEIHQIENIGTYATWSLTNDEIVTYRYLEEKVKIEAYKFNLLTKKISPLENVPLMFKDINGHKFSTDNNFKISCKTNNWEADISDLNMGKIFHVKCIIDNHVIAQTNKNLIGLNLINGIFNWSYQIAPEALILNPSSKILISPKFQLQFVTGKIERLNSDLIIEDKAVVKMSTFDIDSDFIYFPTISKKSLSRSIIEICKAKQSNYSIVDKIELYPDEFSNYTKQLKVHKNKIYVISQSNELTVIEHE